ncbi:MAG TPA: hypothetical protein VD884_06055 [Ohtaekwangia sp.]|nr:hypothetical protein [Ohtaekwangia sp.]
MEIRNNVKMRVLLGISAVAGLAAVFMVQRLDMFALISGRQFNDELHFAVNRTLRIFFNDAFMLLFIYALFADRKVIRLAVGIQILDLFVLFPIYLGLKFSFEGASELSSPFLSQFHRLIVNPTLMILLIPAVYYQKIIQEKR